MKAKRLVPIQKLPAKILFPIVLQGLVFGNAGSGADEESQAFVVSC